MKYNVIRVMYIIRNIIMRHFQYYMDNGHCMSLLYTLASCLLYIPIQLWWIYLWPTFFVRPRLPNLCIACILLSFCSHDTVEIIYSRSNSHFMGITDTLWHCQCLKAVYKSTQCYGLIGQLTNKSISKTSIDIWSLRGIG